MKFNSLRFICVGDVMILEQVKKIMLEELEQFKSNKERIDNQLSECFQRNNTMLSKRFNFIQRNITQRRQYRDMQKKKRESEEELTGLGRESESLEQEIRRFEEEKLPQIESATNLRALGLTLEEAMDILKEHGIEPRLESCREGIEIAGDELTRCKKFMQHAVKEDPRFIRFDKVGEPEVYIGFIDSIISRMNSEDLTERVYISMIENLRKEILNPREVPDDKYKVKTKHILEAIRGFIKEELQLEETRTTFEDYNSSNRQKDIGRRALIDTINSLYIDGMLSKEDGEKLESLYDPNAKIAMHGTDGDHDIFKQGLRASAQPPPERALKRTAKEVHSFLGMIGYKYQNGDRTFPKNYIVKIPENREYIWGTNNERGEILDCYVLPEYVIGQIQVDESSQSAGFVVNNEKDRETYKYLWKDNQNVMRENRISHERSSLDR